MSVPQRFLASSVRGAMSEAKRVLGPEALIIEHRQVNGRVELIAMSSGSGHPGAAGIAAPTAQSATAQDAPAAASVLAEPSIPSLVEEIELALPAMPEAGPRAGAPEPSTAGDQAHAIPDPGIVSSIEAVTAAAATDAKVLSAGPAALQARQPLPDQRSELQGEVGTALQAIGFSAAVGSLLTEQAVTPRLAINELLQLSRFSTWAPMSGLVPVVGAAGAGVTTSLLRLALALRSTQPRLRLHAAASGTLAGNEKLLLGANLLQLPGSSLSPDALRAAVANQVPAELGLLDLSLSAFPRYSNTLRLLQKQKLLEQLVLVVPLHWQPAVYLRELAELDLLWDRSCSVHLIFTGVDRSGRIAPWMELALQQRWSLSLLGASPTLGTSVEPATPTALRRLLLPQIDHPEASTIFTEELLRERGA